MARQSPFVRIRVDRPEDLTGKRFAVGDYQQSADLSIRGMQLQ
jgi:hypothetical protein